MSNNTQPLICIDCNKIQSIEIPEIKVLLGGEDSSTFIDVVKFYYISETRCSECGGMFREIPSLLLSIVDLLINANINVNWYNHSDDRISFGFDDREMFYKFARFLKAVDITITNTPYTLTTEDDGVYLDDTYIIEDVWVNSKDNWNYDKINKLLIDNQLIKFDPPANWLSKFMIGTEGEGSDICYTFQGDIHKEVHFIYSLFKLILSVEDVEKDEY